MTDPLAALARRWEAVPFHRRLGIRVEELSAARARVRLAHGKPTSNRNGALHGGVSASLADVAAALLARAGAPDAAGYSPDLAVTYLAPTASAAIVADARLVRRGRELVHVEVDVADGDGIGILKALAVHRVATGAAADPPMAPPPLPAVEFPPGRAGVSGSPFTAGLGVTVARLGPGRSAVLLPWREDLADDAGSVHEGAVASLVDSAGGVASWAVDGFDRHGRAWTVGMHLHFHGPSRRDDLIAFGETRGRHHGLHFSALTIVERRSQALVATGTITFQIVRPA